MAKFIRYSLFVADTANVTASNQSKIGAIQYNGTDVQVDALWATIEATGALDDGTILSSAYLYEDGVSTDSYIINPNYNLAVLVAEVTGGTASPVTGLVSGLPSAVTVYTPTLTPCSNTTTPTNILAVTIPANDWADGEKITVDVIVTGTSNIASFQLDLTYGSDSYTTIVAGGINSEILRLRTELWRVGSSVYIYNGNSPGTLEAVGAPGALNNTSAQASSPYDSSPSGTSGTILTSITFNTSKDLVITATYDVADAGDSIEILAAKVTKI